MALEGEWTCMSSNSRPLTAAGFWVSVVRVVAASYLTEWDDDSRSSYTQRMYRGYNETRSSRVEFIIGMSPTHAMHRVTNTIFPDEFYDCHLHLLIKAGDLVKH